MSNDGKVPIPGHHTMLIAFSILARSLPLTLVLLVLNIAEAQPKSLPVDQLVIDLSTRTGPVRHGASGWLYGQSAPGIPSINLMEPLQPQISAQKPYAGLQHPMGDASLVAPDYRAAHGRLMQIYMQDIYPNWTYDNLGIDDYLHKVDTMTRQIVNDSNHDLFVYVPFNEPNNNWYADHGPLFTKFLDDWSRVYREIRSIDPGAKIAGPGFEHFNGEAFEQFLRFARDNHVLPDEFTWHELHDDFFPQWYRRVATYRAAEVRLGIAPLPIVINEYTRDRGDLAVPGNLIQWITRLENSKVDGCLAFWTPAGTLADLGARIWPNRPTGAWWLYQWYGSLTGDTIKVTPPDDNAVGLQGIASLDVAKRQVRVIFGGTARPIDLRLRDLAAVPAFHAGVHISLARIASSGVEPSPEPEIIAETNETFSEDGLLHVPAAGADSAYLLILTAPTSGRLPGEHLAVEADLSGNASAHYSRPQGSEALLDSTNPGGSVRFIAAVDHDGFYSLKLRYFPSPGKTAALILDDEPPRSLTLPSSQSEQIARVFLGAGVHRFRLNAVQQDVSLHSLTLTAADGPIALYRPATVAADAVEFSSVRASIAGNYAIILMYSNNEQGHKGQVDQKTNIWVNGEPAQSVWLRNTFSATVFVTTVIRLQLKAGENRIRFAVPDGRSADIESIQVAGSDE